jgi:hypothetical protein
MIPFIADGCSFARLYAVKILDVPRTKKGKTFLFCLPADRKAFTKFGMKCSIIIEEGITQLALSPETPFEKMAVERIYKESTEIKPDVFLGGYYRCAGGWNRENPNQDTLIIRFGEDESGATA